MPVRIDDGNAESWKQYVTPKEEDYKGSYLSYLKDSLGVKINRVAYFITNGETVNDKKIAEAIKSHTAILIPGNNVHKLYQKLPSKYQNIAAAAVQSVREQLDKKPEVVSKLNVNSGNVTTPLAPSPTPRSAPNPQPAHTAPVTNVPIEKEAPKQPLEQFKAQIEDAASGKPLSKNPTLTKTERDVIAFISDHSKHPQDTMFETQALLTYQQAARILGKPKSGTEAEHQERLQTIQYQIVKQAISLGDTSSLRRLKDEIEDNTFNKLSEEQRGELMRNINLRMRTG